MQVVSHCSLLPNSLLKCSSEWQVKGAYFSSVAMLLSLFYSRYVQLGEGTDK